MKTSSLIGILLAVTGLGAVFYFLSKKTPPPASPTANPGTGTPFSALYGGFGKLFGGQPQTDNTGALITASGQAATGLFSAVKSLFPTGGTPVSAPTGGSDFNAGQDPSGFN